MQQPDATHKRQREFRTVEFRTEAREAENGRKELVVRGYPILFNTPTKVWDYWYDEITEIILPQALDGVDLRNVFLLYGHDMNRVLGRVCDNNYVNLHADELLAFSDLAPAHWAYYDIAEAANGHDYVRAPAETWTALR